MDNNIFVTSWHNLCDIVPDNTSDIFFVVNGVIYAGKYDEEVDGFMMADGKGYASEETTGQWMYIPPFITPKSYPEEGQRIVVSIDEYSEKTPFHGVDVTGYFAEDRTGRYFIIEDIYDIDGVVVWEEDVDGWQPIPDVPVPNAEPEPSTATINFADVDNINQNASSDNHSMNETVEITTKDTGLKGFPGKPVVKPADGQEIDIKRCGCDYYQKGNYNAAENVFVYNNGETGEPEAISFDEVDEWNPSRVYR